MIVKKHAKNIHEIQMDGKQVKIAMLSDIHWDNPKCDWNILKKDLDYCKDNNIPIMINGDMFCLMQGRGDRRGNKSDIRPGTVVVEGSNGNKYFVDTIRRSCSCPSYKYRGGCKHVESL